MPSNLHVPTLRWYTGLEVTMKLLELPSPIQSYFSAKGTDAETAAACFTDDAVVFDNGEDLEMKGIAAISSWLSRTNTSYKLTSEVRSAEERDGAYVLDVVLSGDFPGSPYQFEYRFKLSGEKIQELAIDPIGPLNP